VTPSGGKLAGRHGFGMLCVAATQTGGYDALGINWKIANDVAAENGRKMDPERLRLVGPVHIAETKQKAMENIRFGFHKWADYFSKINPASATQDKNADPLEQGIKDGVLVVGTPDDAIAQIKRLQAKQGEFGCFLQLAHNWANFDNTKKSYELWQRHVTPVINKANVNRQDSFDDASRHSEKYIGAAMGAVMATIQKHAIEQAAKEKKPAAE
jgi:limonene 1,2-monooxygenase